MPQEYPISRIKASIVLISYTGRTLSVGRKIVRLSRDSIFRLYSRAPRIYSWECVNIGCHSEDGMFTLDDGYFDNSAHQLTENLEGATLDGMKGFCHHCGGYFNVDHVDEKRSWFRPENE